MSYDQWKTASPYDDEPDPISEAERLMKDNEKVFEGKASIHLDDLPGEFERALTVVDALLQVISDEGLRK